MYPTNTVVDINAPRRIPQNTSMLHGFVHLSSALGMRWATCLLTAVVHAYRRLWPSPCDALSVLYAKWTVEA